LVVPGHTPGSTAVWFESERVLIAGDAIASHNGRLILGVFTPTQPQRETAFAVSRA
jgi:glyoxylase-like metal-dependent hydrolase (beta-lactamase superfamily II)